MYKVASDRRQAALHRGGPWDWANGEERVSHEDERESLRLVLRKMEEELANADLPLPRRRELGRRKIEMQERAKALKAIVGREKLLREGASQFFVDVARRRLIKTEYAAIWREANEMYDAELAKLREASAALDGAGHPPL